MRKRPNLEPRMERCAQYLAAEPEKYRGIWRQSFAPGARLYLELGCGKGRFTVDSAEREPEAFFIGLEKVQDAMVIAMERAAERGVSNLRFIDGDAATLEAMFAPGELDRIYLNFSDPWPKSRDAKFRLTAPVFLRSYCELLPVGGQIHFKTDNSPLFLWSLEQFAAERWKLSEISRDLHGPGMPPTVLTDYELKFMDRGVKINRLVAERTGETLGLAAGRPPRLRKAALSDARGYEVRVITLGGERETD